MQDGSGRITVVLLEGFKVVVAIVVAGGVVVCFVCFVAVGCVWGGMRTRMFTRM